MASLSFLGFLGLRSYKTNGLDQVRPRFSCSCPGWVSLAAEPSASMPEKGTCLNNQSEQHNCHLSFWMCVLGGEGRRERNKRNLLRQKHCLGAFFWERHLSLWNCPLPINQKEQKSGLSFALFFIQTPPVPTGKPTAVVFLLVAPWPLASICLTGMRPLQWITPHSASSRRDGREGLLVQ